MTTEPKPIEVFFSYSHKDEALRDKLATHLSLLRRGGVITAWHDRQIEAGEEWKSAIDTHLESAQVILLLISADFLASDYCYEKEMGRALERHAAGEARVVPVILRACDWKDAPFGKLQAFPKDAKPITSWSNQDEAFTDVASGLRQLAQRLRSNPPSPVAVPSPKPSGSSQPPPANVQIDLSGLSFTERSQLADKLLACPCLSSPSARANVVSELPQLLKDGIRFAPNATAREEVLSILETCLNYGDGLDKLLEIVRYHDGGTTQLGQLEAYLAQFKK